MHNNQQERILIGDTTVVRTVHHGAVLWIPYDPNLTIVMLRLTASTANVRGQLPQGRSLLERIARKVQRSEHLVNAALVRLQTEYHHRLLVVLLQKSSDRACSARKNGS